MSGLLGPNVNPIDFGKMVPTPAFREPSVNMLVGSLSLGDMMADAMEGDDGDSRYPGPLAEYQAGLQPGIPPSGTPWQDEIIFDRLARTDREMQGIVQTYFEQARSYDSQLSRDRMRASDYYNGRPLGDEEAGRSQLVLTTVRDTVLATLPSLLRVFTAAEHPAQFMPFVADNEQIGLMHAELARQATLYAEWALFVANDGWMILHDCIKDALTRRVGWVRWYWGQQRAQRIEECNRLLQPQLRLLLQEPGIAAQRVTRRPMLPNEIRAVMATPEGAAYFQMGGQPLFYSARITRAAARAWPIVESVRSESVWIVSDADDPADARAVFHVRDVPASQLIAAGLPRDKVMDAAGTAISSRQEAERRKRDPAAADAPYGVGSGTDKAMQFVRYVEGWCQIDTDGDGVAELVHVHGVGNEAKLIRWDRTDEVSLAGFQCYREPGRVVGLSQADMTMDLQRTQTKVTRAILDSLGQSIFPRTVAQVGATNMEDVRQTAIGTIIRVTQQGAVQELSKPFIGGQALPIIEFLDSLRESRTGITRTSQGLTAEALQSTSPVAVGAQLSASQDRLDMIARTMGQTGLVPLYKGLLRLLAKHQDRPNVLSIRGKWVPIDPRALSIMFAVQCNIGGKGSPAEQMAFLQGIAAKQEQILAPAVARGMLDTPLVGLPEYRNTLARMCELAGASDVTTFFKSLPPDWQPPPPPPPQPSPDEVLAGVEQAKVAAGAADDARQSETDRVKIMLDDDREREKAAVDAWVQAYSASIKERVPFPTIQEFLHAMAPAPQPWPEPGATGTPPGMPPIAPPGGIGPAPPAANIAGLGGARGTALLPPPGGAGFPGRVASAPIAVPPNAAGPQNRMAIDPATLLAMRQAMLSRGGDAAGAALRARALGGAGNAAPGGAGQS